MNSLNTSYPASNATIVPRTISGTKSRPISRTRATLVFFQIFNAVMIAIVFYVLINMILYGKRTRMWKSSSDKTKVDRGKIYIVCLVAACWSIPRLIITQLLFQKSTISNCDDLMDFGIVIYFVSMWLVYFFLWLRHRAIYSYPTVKQLMGKYSNCLSWFVLVIASIASLSVLVSWVHFLEYVPGKHGCVVQVTNRTGTDVVMFWEMYGSYILGVFLLVCQLSLLTLFIYPMIVTRNLRNEHRGSPGNYETHVARYRRSFMQLVTDCGFLRRTEGSDNISSIISRSIVSATITISSDICVALLVALLVPLTSPRAVVYSLYDISMVVNVLCMLVTFNNASRIVSSVFRNSTSRSHSVGTESMNSRQNQAQTLNQSVTVEP